MEKSDEEQDTYIYIFFIFFSFKFIKDLPTKYILNTEGKRVTLWQKPSSDTSLVKGSDQTSLAMGQITVSCPLTRITRTLTPLLRF